MTMQALKLNIDDLLKDTSTFDRAKIVKLSVGTWTAKKKAKDLNHTTAAREGISEKMISTYKRIIESETLADTLKAYNKIRTVHYEDTIPFGNDDITPNTKVETYQEKIDDLIDNASKLADIFSYEVYPKAQEAAKYLLNGEFNEADYPAPHVVRAKFYARYTIMDMPKVNSVLTGLTDYQKAKLANNMQDYFKQAMADALAKPFADITQSMSHIVEVTQSKATFRDVTFEKLSDFVSRLHEFNIFDDPGLKSIANQIGSKLAKVDPQDVRDNDTTREIVLTTAKDILTQVSDYL